MDKVHIVNFHTELISFIEENEFERKTVNDNFEIWNVYGGDRDTKGYK